MQYHWGMCVKKSICIIEPSPAHPQCAAPARLQCSLPPFCQTFITALYKRQQP